MNANGLHALLSGALDVRVVTYVALFAVLFVLWAAASAVRDPETCGRGSAHHDARYPVGEPHFCGYDVCRCQRLVCTRCGSVRSERRGELDTVTLRYAIRERRVPRWRRRGWVRRRAMFARWHDAEAMRLRMAAPDGFEVVEARQPRRVLASDVDAVSGQAHPSAVTLFERAGERVAS